jgi:hypothetical protein
MQPAVDVWKLVSKTQRSEKWKNKAGSCKSVNRNCSFYLKPNRTLPDKKKRNYVNILLVYSSILIKTLNVSLDISSTNIDTFVAFFTSALKPAA